MLVDITVVTADGRRLNRTNVPFSQIRDGGTIDMPPRVVTRQPAFRVSENQTPVPRDRIFTSYTYFGASVIPNSGSLGIIETFAATGQETNRFERRDGAVGAGFSLGYVSPVAFGPGGDPLILTPFLSFDFPNNTVEHRFSPTAFIGERVNFVGTAGLQFGRMVTPDLQIYGLVGVALVNKEFTIDFGGPIRSADSQWLFGGTIGIGGNYQQPGWTFMGRPITIFAQYQHVFVQDGEMNQPAVSPAFNYRFENDLDILKFGVNVPLGGGPNGGGIMSDVRLKRDLLPVARLADGLTLYRYRYLWDGTEYVGVMAQEVADVRPDAVLHGSDGFMRVDYARLGLRMQTWHEWSMAH